MRVRLGRFLLTISPYSHYDLVPKVKKNSNRKFYSNANIALAITARDKNAAVTFSVSEDENADVRPFISFSALSFFTRRKKRSPEERRPRRLPRSLPTCAGAGEGSVIGILNARRGAARSTGIFRGTLSHQVRHIFIPSAPYVIPDPVARNTFALYRGGDGGGSIRS